MDDDDDVELNFKVFSESASSYFSLYPADLDNDELEISSLSLSLSRLCCTEVVRHSELLKDDRIHLPSNLFPKLLTEAIRKDFRDSALHLMSVWPTKIISLIEVLPYVKGVFSLLVSLNCHSKCRRKASRGLAMFLSLCLDVLQSGLTKTLRVLDLRGVLLSEYTVNLFFQKMISLPKCVLLSDDYHVIMDCEFGRRATIKRLLNLIKITRISKKIKIHLHFNVLNLCCFFDQTDIRLVWKFLQQIDPTELIGLYISITSDDIVTKILARFPSLISLGLGQATKAILPFHLLPRLRRLSLYCGSNDVSSRVSKSILAQLEYLRVDRGQSTTRQKDFLYLTSFPLYLRELDLSNRTVRESELHLWRKLFLSLVPTLMLLQLENCIDEYDNVFFSPIIDCILPLVNLVCLDMVGNEVKMEVMFEHVPKLGALPKLKRILLSLPYYGEDKQLAGAYGALKKFWCEAIQQKTAAAKLVPTKINWYSIDDLNFC